MAPRMRPRQSLVDALAVVLMLLGVLNFFSPALGIPRDPLITYALVGLAGVIFGFGSGGSSGGPGAGSATPARRRATTDRTGDSDTS